jgi:hypothetical protein
MINWFDKLKEKEDIFILFLLFLLILPRVAAYGGFGAGIVGTDAEFRYFPQVEELSKSFLSFFNQTGPLYTLFLLVFGKLTGNLVAFPVLLQHILGIVSAFLVFYYFKKVNLLLAFIVTVFSFSVPMAIWLEHTILREALFSFFLVLLVLLLFLEAKDDKYLKFSFGLLAGLLGLILIFLRIEIIILVVLIPLILFLIKKRKSPDFKFKDRAFLKWILGYFCLFFIVFILYNIFPKKPKIIEEYGSYFSVAFYSLRAETFYYKNSQYPELLERYQKIFKNPSEKAGGSINEIYKETQNYLSEHPEIKLSLSEIIDKIYLEIITKNTRLYLKSFFINLKNQLMGIAELNSSVTKDRYKMVSGIYLIDKLLLFFNFFMLFLSQVLFWLFLPALPFFFKKWKTLPDEVIISFLIGAIHILVLAFFANPAHRFRYALDPFIYFAQLYLILIFLNALISKTRSYNIKR